MELKEFISKTLTDIIEGVSDAQNRLQEANSTGVVNATKGIYVSDPTHEQTIKKARKVHDIEIDVAVSAEHIKSATGGGGLKIQVLSVSGGTEKVSKSNSVSRVKFTIPVLYPH